MPRNGERAVLNSGDAAQADWSAPAIAVDPKPTYETARSFMAAADGIADPEKKRALEMQAAVALRNAIYAFETPEYEAAFAEWGPRVYAQYGRLLKSKFDWPEQAATTMLTGSAKIAEMWKNKTDGGLWRKGDEITDIGKGAQGVISSAQSYIAGLRRINDSSVARMMTEEVNEYAATADVFTDDRRLIVDYLQTGRFDDSLALAATYLKSQEAEGNVDRTLWASRMTAYANYKKFDKARRDKNTRVADEAFAALEVALVDLKTRADKELAKENPVSEAQKCKNTWLTLELARLVKGEKYVEALSLFGPEFWEEPPGDAALLQMCANQLAVAAYKHMIGIARNPEKVKDLGLAVETMPYYDNALLAVNRVKELVPGSSLTGSSQRVAACYRTAAKQFEKLIPAAEAGQEGYTGFDLDELRGLHRRAVLSYADLLEPTFNNSTQPEKYLALGNDLMSVKEYRRASKNLEKYIEVLAEDPQLKAFAQDPAAVIDPVGAALVKTRSSFKKPWDEIRDLLIDDPAFVKQYHLDREDQWKEQPRNFFGALRLLNELNGQLESQRAMLGQAGEDLMKQVGGLVETVQKLARTIAVTTDLVECYSQLGRYDRMAKRAVQLYNYDKLRVEYRLWYVTSVIEAAKAGKATKDEMKAARTVAAGLRSDTRPFPDKQELYWESVVQIMELSQMLGEIDIIMRSLKRQNVDNINPAQDLFKGGTDPREPQSDKALKLLNVI